ncbi:MAG: hypothetical protein ACFFBH_12635 [Promethearchaeota archaeon]
MIYETWSSGEYSQGDTYLDSVGLINYNGYDQGDNLEIYSCDGTPFVEGTIVIVIPTSLFTRTELHHYIENNQLEQTVLYSDEEGLFEMIANERNGESDAGCADVDYVFIRYDISPDEAMAVLNMVLQGMIEETLDENNNTVYINGTINEYLSSKLDGIRATLLNLPYASLGYIPWVMNYFNSPTGPQPHPADPLGIFIWLITWLIPILHVIIFVIVNMLVSDSTGFILNFAKAIFMKLLTALGDLLWLIIRAAILVFAYIEFALLLMIFLPVFLFLIATFLIFSIFMSNTTYTVEINSISFTHENKFFTFIYVIVLEYIEFFDIFIPTLCLKYETECYCSYLLFNLFQMSTTIPLDDYAMFMSDILHSSGPKSSSLNLKSSSSSESDINPSYLKGFSTFFTWVSFFTALFGFQTLIESNDFVELIIFIFTFLVFISSIFTLLYTLISEGDSLNLGLGFFTGYCLSLLITCAISIPILLLKASASNFQAITAAASLILLIYILSSDICDIIFFCCNINLPVDYFISKVLFDLLLGLGCTITGAVLLGLDEHGQKKIIIWIVIGWIILHFIPFFLLK